MPAKSIENLTKYEDDLEILENSFFADIDLLSVKTFPRIQFRQNFARETSAETKIESQRKHASQEQKRVAEASDFKILKIVPTNIFMQSCVKLYCTSYKSLDSVYEMQIKGWKFDELIFKALKPGFRNLKSLTSLSFWRAGLTPKMIYVLRDFISESKKILMVKVEGNHAIYPACYDELIIAEGNLKHLSVRFSNLSTAGVKAIADKIGNMKSSHRSMLSLDLGGNRITDEGACYIAQALRCNRSIKMLALGNNCISDIGVMALCEVVTLFYVTTEELVYRRKLQSEVLLSRSSDAKPNDNNFDIGSATLRSMSDRNKKDDKEKGNRGGKSGKNGKSKTKLLMKSMQNLKLQSKNNIVSETETNQENLDNLELIHPLLAAGEIKIPYGFRIHGNYELSIINLSYNKITHVGLDLLTKSVALQKERLTTASEKIGRGLTDILVKKNGFSEHDKYLQLLNLELTNKCEWKPNIATLTSVAPSI